MNRNPINSDNPIEIRLDLHHLCFVSMRNVEFIMVKSYKLYTIHCKEMYFLMNRDVTNIHDVQILGLVESGCSLLSGVQISLKLYSIFKRSQLSHFKIK